MDVEGFLNDVRGSPDYAGQAVYVREVAARDAVFGETAEPVSEPA